MPLSRLLAPLLAALLIAACGSGPEPFDRLDYVGEWHGDNVRLLIRPDGHVLYERLSGSGHTRIDAPIQRFEGDSFVVGVGVLTTTFVVTSPPHIDEGEWKMTVDGVELVRRAPADELRARAPPFTAFLASRR